MNFHVLVGDSGNDPVSFQAAARSRASIDWAVPKQTEKGDIATVYVHGKGFIGIAVVSGAPRPGTPKGGGRYLARISSLRQFEVPILLDLVSAQTPEWKWPTYPRSYTTPPEAIQPLVYQALLNMEYGPIPEPDLWSANEGTKSLRTHLIIERNQALIARKRAQCLARHGDLACEVCGFSFEGKYGDAGRGICEVHHLVPLSQASSGRRTTLDDLAILCANCHRVAHRRVDLSIAELKRLVLE